MQAHRFTLHTPQQQGEIHIERLGGVEFKKALLHTHATTRQSLCFDPDIRLIFTLAGRTHLRFGSCQIRLQADSDRSAVLLPINQAVQGEKIFHTGQQNEIVLFCSSTELEQLGCPADVVKVLRQSHLQARYFAIAETVKTQLYQLAAQQDMPADGWSHFMRKTQIIHLIAQVLRQLFPLSPAGQADSLRQKRLKKLVALLHDRNLQAASLDTLAQLCHSNPTTLQRDFQAAFGSSIARYRREQRLQQAREMLKQQQSVADVARQVGYDNPECFSKAFKKHFGKSPNGYRPKPAFRQPEN